MKIYIAAPFFNPEQLKQVFDIENLLDEREIEYFSPRSFGVIKDMTPEEKEKNMKDIFCKNVAEIRKCSTLLVLTDHKDTGTTWELGFTYGLNLNTTPFHNKKIVTVSLEKKPVNVMLRYCIDAHAQTLEELNTIISHISYGKDLSVFKNKPEVNE